MLLWGYKTCALFDVWSIEHFFSGMNLRLPAVWLGLRIIPINGAPPENVPLRITLLMVTLIGLIWEVVEHYLETGLAGEAVAYWFQGVEYWANRLITDMALLLLGAWAVTVRPGLALFAQCFSLTWLTVHIFVFPQSMYLQDLMEKALR